MSDSATLTLPVLPLRNGVVFPGMVVTIALESTEARRAVAAAEDGSGRVLLVPRIDGDYAKVGTVAALEQVESSGPVRGALVRGLARARVGAGQIGDAGALLVEIEILDEPLVEDPEQIAALATEYRAVIGAILEHRGVAALAERLLAVDDPGELADLAAYSPDLTLAQKVELLETLSVERRLTMLLDWMGSLLGELSLREKVREDAAERLDKGQREYVLRQQMAAIRKSSARKTATSPVSTERSSTRPTSRTRSRRRSPERSTGWSASVSKAPSTAGYAPGSTPCSTFPGARPRRTTSSSKTPRACSTPTTPVWRMSRSAFSSTWPSASSARSVGCSPRKAGAPAPSFFSPGRLGSGRPRSASRWPGPWGVRL